MVYACFALVAPERGGASPHQFMPKKLPEEQLDALVLEAQEGNKDAFARIYDHYFDPIFRYVFFRVPEMEVDDIVETVFIKCWTKMPQYQKRDVSFGAWLFRIAHNAVIDYRRAHRPVAQIDPRMSDESRAAKPKQRTERQLMAEKLRFAVSQLKEPYRQVVTLKFLMGLSNKEVAEIMHEREGNIRVIQFRALKKLRLILEEHHINIKTL